MSNPHRQTRRDWDFAPYLFAYFTHHSCVAFERSAVVCVATLNRRRNPSPATSKILGAEAGPPSSLRHSPISIPHRNLARVISEASKRGLVFFTEARSLYTTSNQVFYRNSTDLPYIVLHSGWKIARKLYFVLN